MELDGYIDRLHGDLAAAAAGSRGEAVAEAAERLAGALDSALRLVLLEALADAAAEITAELDGATVEVRLHGRQPDLVITAALPPPDAPALALPPPPITAPGGEAGDDDDVDGASTARITLRLPEPLKQRAEDAAAGARQSLNTWLLDAIRAAIRDRQPRARRRGPGEHLSGWVR